MPALLSEISIPALLIKQFIRIYEVIVAYREILAYEVIVAYGEIGTYTKMSVRGSLFITFSFKINCLI